MNKYQGRVLVVLFGVAGLGLVGLALLFGALGLPTEWIWKALGM